VVKISITEWMRAVRDCSSAIRRFALNAGDLEDLRAAAAWERVSENTRAWPAGSATTAKVALEFGEMWISDSGFRGWGLIEPELRPLTMFKVTFQLQYQWERFRINPWLPSR